MARRRAVTPVRLAAFAVAVLAVPLLAGRVAVPSEAAAVASDRLVGLWTAHRPGGEGDPVQFYYFHGDGHGLYRYGRVGATNTNSFDYAIDGDALVLRFRKTGAAHRVHFAIDEHGGEATLVLDDDPRAGGSRRYVRTRTDPVEHDVAGACADAAPRVDGRLWMDKTSYATGGYGFGLYQLRCAGIDGRGTGWFHRGDFDDWTTEAFVYRLAGDRLELQFAGGGALERTGFALQPGKPPALTLANDPRDFWHEHRYVDVGPSFGAISEAAAWPPAAP